MLCRVVFALLAAIASSAGAANADTGAGRPSLAIATPVGRSLAVDLLPPVKAGAAVSTAWSCRGRPPDITLLTRAQNTHRTLSSRPGKVSVFNNARIGVMSQRLDPLAPQQITPIRLSFLHGGGCSGEIYEVKTEIPYGPVGVRNGRRFFVTQPQSWRLEENRRFPCAPHGVGNCPMPLRSPADSRCRIYEAENYSVSIARAEGGRRKNQRLRITGVIAHSNWNGGWPSRPKKLLLKGPGGNVERFDIPMIPAGGRFTFSFESTAPWTLSPGRCYELELERPARPVDQCNEAIARAVRLAGCGLDRSRSCLDSFTVEDAYWDGNIVRVCESVDELQLYDAGTSVETPG